MNLRDLPAVLLEPGVPLDAALRDLKRRVERSGVLLVLPGQRRRDARRARARERRRARRQAAAPA